MRRLSPLLLAAALFFAVSGGPYGLEPVLAPGAGIGLLLIVLTPIFWAAPIALMTAELASAIPAEGGYYVWARRAFGPFAGWLCAGWSWLYSWVDAAIYPVLFAEYVSPWFVRGGVEDRPWLKWAFGLLAIVPFTYLNLRGAVPVGRASVGLMVAVLAPFAVLVALGLPHVLAHPAAVVQPFLAPGQDVQGALAAGLFVVMWNYLGWDNLSTVAGEVRDPARTYPRVLLVMLPVVTLVYLLPALAGQAYLPDPVAWKEGVWPEVARRAGGEPLALAVTIGGVLSALGLFSALLLAESRLPFALARDGYLPPAMARRHPRYGTPYIAILLSATMYTLLSFASFKDLAVVDVVLYSGALVLEFAALGWLRWREPGLPRPFRVPGGWPGVALVTLMPLAVIAFGIWSQFREESRAAEWSLYALGIPVVLWPIAKRGWAWRGFTRRR